jgi:hypothetical protein
MNGNLSEVNKCLGPLEFICKQNLSSFLFHAGNLFQLKYIRWIRRILWKRKTELTLIAETLTEKLSVRRQHTWFYGVDVRSTTHLSVLFENSIVVSHSIWLGQCYINSSVETVSLHNLRSINHLGCGILSITENLQNFIEVIELYFPYRNTFISKLYQHVSCFMNYQCYILLNEKRKDDYYWCFGNVVTQGIFAWKNSEIP